MQVRREKLLSALWGLYGRYVWDDLGDEAHVSDPPQRMVDLLLARRRSEADRVLDAGCGTGNYAVALAQAGFLVLGTDYAQGMLDKAQSKVTPELQGRLSFRPADQNLPLPFPDGSFDHALSISVLHALANPALAIRELQRVLKPDGTLVLSLPKANLSPQYRSTWALIRFRLGHLRHRTPGRVLLVALKAWADRRGGRPRWSAAQAQDMAASSGFHVLSVEEGRQILLVAEKRSLTESSVP